MTVESLRVYRYEPAPNRRGIYHNIYDFQWARPDGDPAGLRCVVARNHGIRGDYFRTTQTFGTLALRRVGDETEFRAELRIGGCVYELPIQNGNDEENQWLIP